MCKSWCEMIIGIVILVFTLWWTAVSEWILIIAGIVLIVHSFTCRTCFAGKEMPARSSRRR